MPYMLIEDFLNINQCEEIINLARSRLFISRTWDDRRGRSVVSTYRKSQHMFLKIGETKLIRHIEQRIANIIGVPVENGEPLQIVRYSEGGYYKPHLDAIDPRWPSNQFELSKGGQRIFTVLLYLNTLSSAGGETFFPNMGLKVEPKQGMALFWQNIDRNGNIDARARHEAKPVIIGEKWIATKWLRESRYRYKT